LFLPGHVPKVLAIVTAVDAEIADPEAIAVAGIAGVVLVADVEEIADREGKSHRLKPVPQVRSWRSLRPNLSL
jgi:hypothetical protein